MKLECIRAKDLLALHNKIPDKPTGPKTFSICDKFVARIQTTIVDTNDAPAYIGITDDRGQQGF